MLDSLWPVKVCFTHTLSHQLISGANTFCSVDLQKKYRKEFLLGYILTAAYCPQDPCFLKNCHLGYYCPDAETLNTCPKSTFLPIR